MTATGKLKPNDFKDLRLKGLKFKTSHFLFVYQILDSPGNSNLFFGMTVTRKIGNAVVRNRLKRLIREAFKNLLKVHKLSVLPDQTAYINVVVLKSPQTSFGYIHVTQQVLHFFKHRIFKPQ